MVTPPLVSVVTPVYNGEKYLAECIESVCAQSYKNWEYIISNNCSTDRSLEIAEYYAQRDKRICVYTNEEFVPSLRNQNLALKRTSQKSKYCKVVHADDKLLPECIERMVEVAEMHPNVGVVSSYIILYSSSNSEVRCVGIPYPRTVVDGKEICRSTFRGEFTVFGPPSVTLIRYDLIRKYEPFYNEDLVYADNDANFRLLQECDFGFVHQILSCIRIHEESQSKKLGETYNKGILEFLAMLSKYGPSVFAEHEFRKILRMRFRMYYRFLAKSIFLVREKRFWKYHISGLSSMGHPFNPLKLLCGLFLEGWAVMLNPRDTYRRIRKVMRG